MSDPMKFSIRMSVPDIEFENALWFRRITKELELEMAKEVLGDIFQADIFCEGTPDLFVPEDDVNILASLLASIALEGPGLPPLKCVAADIKVDLVADRVMADVYFCTYAEYFGDLYAAAPSSRAFFQEEETVMYTELPQWLRTKSTKETNTSGESTET